MITLRHDNLPPISIAGRAESVLALVVAHANQINSMYSGSVEVHFSNRGWMKLWLKDCVEDQAAHSSPERGTLTPVQPNTGDVN